MRIGILTFFGNNYGAVLQCYALQQLLVKERNQVEIINFAPTKIGLRKQIVKKVRSIDTPRQIVEFLFQFLTSRGKEKKDAMNNTLLAKGFDEFRKKYINLSKPLTEKEIGIYANLSYDAVYVGSDQVWTDLYTDQLTFFLDWLPDFEGLRISYAACSAHQKVIHQNQKEKIKRLLQKFDTITVRDTTTSRLVESIMGTKPEIKQDPTENYNFKEFLQDAIFKTPYILAYVMGDEIKGGFQDAILRIKKQVGNLPVICVALSKKQKITKFVNKVYLSATPEEWLNLIRCATVVLTDSYHGVLFSSKYNVPYVGYIKSYIRSTRLLDLKERRGFKNIVTISSDIDDIQLVG